MNTYVFSMRMTNANAVVGLWFNGKYGPCIQGTVASTYGENQRTPVAS